MEKMPTGTKSWKGKILTRNKGEMEKNADRDSI
jgi:hypothetical protein